MATKRTFTHEQKLEILQQAETMGITPVLRQHSLSYSVFARWRENLLERDPHKDKMIQSNKSKSELKQFIEENTRLKKIIADQALELERKDEVLKKNNSLHGKR